MNKLLWYAFFLVSLAGINSNIWAISDADDDDDRATVHLPMTYTEIYVPVAEIARVKAEILAGYDEWLKLVNGRIDLIDQPSKHFFNHYADSRAGIASLVEYLESLRTAIKKTKTLFRLKGITGALHHTSSPETIKIEIPKYLTDWSTEALNALLDDVIVIPDYPNLTLEQFRVIMRNLRETPTELEINNVAEILDLFLFQLEVPTVI